MDQSKVPKFASFRPKPKPASEAPVTSEPRKRSSRDRDRVRSHGKDPKEEYQTTASKATSSKDALTTDIYTIDRRGDRDIVRYGTQDEYEIPSYRRYGYGCVLGLSQRQKIDRAVSSSKEIYLMNSEGQRRERLLTRKQPSSSSTQQPRRLRPSTQTLDPDQDFVEFTSNVKRVSRESDDGDDDDGVGNPPWGLLDKQNAEMHDEQEVDDDSDIEGTFVNKDALRKQSELSRRTRQSPEDLEAWLDLATHQYTVLNFDAPIVDLTTAQRTHLANVRIEIYEEALKHIGPNQQYGVMLCKSLLKEARHSWEDHRLAKKCKEVLAKYPNCVDLWMIYIDFLQSSLSEFRYESCKTAIFHAFQALQVKSDATDAEVTLHLLLRLTSMAQLSGYQELALSVWQAVLELHHFSANSAPQDHEEGIVAMEEHWDDGARRIGDEPTKGFVRAGDVEHTPKAPSLQQKDAFDTAVQDFQRREVDAIKKLRYPGRGDDDLDEDDAFHTVFFSDIKDYLKLVPAQASPILVVDAFLCFCGLPPLPSSGKNKSKWWQDPFLVQGSTLPAAGPADSFTDTLKNDLSPPLSQFQMTTSLLFDQDFALENIRLPPQFVRRVLNTLAMAPTSEDIVGEYLLAFELYHFREQVQKTAKKLIKARPSSLRLYNAFGLVESRRGNTAAAENVFAAALSMQSEEPTLATSSKLEILSNLVWETLRSGKGDAALSRLVSQQPELHVQPDANEVPASRERLRGQIEAALLNRELDIAIIATSLLALQIYLTNDSNAQLALDIFQNLSLWLTSHNLTTSPHAELHAQSIARFLAHYAMHARIVRPSIIRTALEPLIHTFPNSTLLLALYAANEARFSINDRVRGIMQQSTLDRAEEVSVAVWAFAIHFETLRGQIGGSTAHSIRTLYRRATSTGVSGQRSPALWTSNLHFELSQFQEMSAQVSKGPKAHHRSKEGDRWSLRVKEARQRVKDVFYAGLKNLPWCKDFIMLAFTEAKDVFSEEELRRVYDIMQEKELRLYIEMADAT